MFCNCQRCLVSMLEKGERYKIYSSSLREWHNKEGKFHREDGPAYEGANGDKVWYLNGEHHREDGPAYEGANGYKAWYLNGERHREDGPAIEYAEGGKEWYIKGKRIKDA